MSKSKFAASSGMSTSARLARAGSRATGVLSVLLVVAMLPVAVLFIVVWLAGWQLGFVRTGSMEPALPTGSLVVMSPVTADEVEAGMVIEFVDPRDENKHITHRVVRVQRDDSGNLSFVTKGDANSDRDTAEVPPENVRSKVRWHVGGLGLVLWQLQWPRALVFVLVPVMLIGLSTIFRLAAGAHEASPGAAVTAAASSGGKAPRWGPVACLACRVVIDEADRYCRVCGTRQIAAPAGSADRGPPADGSAGHQRHNERVLAGVGRR